MFERFVFKCAFIDSLLWLLFQLDFSVLFYFFVISCIYFLLFNCKCIQLRLCFFMNFLYVKFCKFYSSTLRASDTQLSPSHAVSSLSPSYAWNEIQICMYIQFVHSTYTRTLTHTNVILFFCFFFLRVLLQMYVEMICEFSNGFCWWLHFSFLFRYSRLVCAFLH